MKKLFVPLLIVSLTLSIASCDKGKLEAPAPTQNTNASASPAPIPTTSSPSIEKQMDDLRENNGDVSKEDKERIDNVPVIPDVFGS